MYKFIDTSEVNAVLEEMFKRYNFILRDMEPEVPRVTEYPYLPGYKDSKIIYDTETYYFCIFFYSPNANYLNIQEFYAPNQGKKLLKALLDHFTDEGKTKLFNIWLEIIDVNKRAKKFWMRELNDLETVKKEAYWITEYNFIHLNKREGVSND